MAFAVLTLTSCGGNDDSAQQTTATATPTPTPEPTPTPTPEPDEPDNGEGDEEYEEEVEDIVLDEATYVLLMSSYFVDEFEFLVDYILELFEDLGFILDENDFLLWLEEFYEVVHYVEEISNELIEMSLLVPAALLDTHINFVAAVNAIYSAMLDVDDALAAGILGSEELMWAGIENFIVNLVIANVLWTEALFGIGLYVPAFDLTLAGGWMSEDGLVYEFFINSMGERTIGGVGEIFEFEIIDDVIIMEFMTHVEAWYIEFAGNDLVFASDDFPGFVFPFTRVW